MEEARFSASSGPWVAAAAAHVHGVRRIRVWLAASAAGSSLAPHTDLTLDGSHGLGAHPQLVVSSAVWRIARDESHAALVAVPACCVVAVAADGRSASVWLVVAHVADSDGGDGPTTAAPRLHACAPMALHVPPGLTAIVAAFAPSAPPAAGVLTPTWTLLVACDDTRDARPGGPVAPASLVHFWLLPAVVAGVGSGVDARLEWLAHTAQAAVVRRFSSRRMAPAAVAAHSEAPAPVPPRRWTAMAVCRAPTGGVSSGDGGAAARDTVGSAPSSLLVAAMCGAGGVLDVVSSDDALAIGGDEEDCNDATGGSDDARAVSVQLPGHHASTEAPVAAAFVAPAHVISGDGTAVAAAAASRLQLVLAFDAPPRPLAPSRDRLGVPVGADADAGAPVTPSAVAVLTRHGHAAPLSPPVFVSPELNMAVAEMREATAARRRARAAAADAEDEPPSAERNTVGGGGGGVLAHLLHIAGAGEGGGVMSAATVAAVTAALSDSAAPRPLAPAPELRRVTAATLGASQPTSLDGRLAALVAAGTLTMPRAGLRAPPLGPSGGGGYDTEALAPVAAGSAAAAAAAAPMAAAAGVSVVARDERVATVAGAGPRMPRVPCAYVVVIDVSAPARSRGGPTADASSAACSSSLPTAASDGGQPAPRVVRLDGMAHVLQLQLQVDAASAETAPAADAVAGVRCADAACVTVLGATQIADDSAALVAASLLVPHAAAADSSMRVDAAESAGCPLPLLPRGGCGALLQRLSPARNAGDDSVAVAVVAFHGRPGGTGGDGSGGGDGDSSVEASRGRYPHLSVRRVLLRGATVADAVIGGGAAAATVSDDAPGNAGCSSPMLLCAAGQPTSSSALLAGTAAAGVAASGTHPLLFVPRASDGGGGPGLATSHASARAPVPVAAMTAHPQVAVAHAGATLPSAACVRAEALAAAAGARAAAALALLAVADALAAAAETSRVPLGHNGAQVPDSAGRDHESGQRGGGAVGAGALQVDADLHAARAAALRACAVLAERSM